MKCRETRRLLSLYVGGDLSEERSALMADHLADCEPCRREYARFEECRTVLFRLKGDARGEAPDLWPGIRRKILMEGRPRSHAWLRTAAAVGLLVGGALAVMMAGPGTKAPGRVTQDPEPGVTEVVEGPIAPPVGGGDGNFFLAELAAPMEEVGGLPALRPTTGASRERDEF